MMPTVLRPRPDSTGAQAGPGPMVRGQATPAHPPGAVTGTTTPVDPGYHRRLTVRRGHQPGNTTAARRADPRPALTIDGDLAVTRLGIDP